MNKEEFEETYCKKCGSQRCEGIDTEWGEGCQFYSEYQQNSNEKEN